MCMYLCSLGPVCGVLSCFTCVDSVTLWTVAHQAPLSMGSSKQEHWGGLLCPPPATFPTQVSHRYLLRLLHWQAGSLPSAAPTMLQKTCWSLNRELTQFQTSHTMAGRPEFGSGPARRPCSLTTLAGLLTWDVIPWRLWDQAQPALHLQGKPAG